MVESGAVSLFFPHGIGHLVGLGVRDAAGPLASRRDTPSPVKNLRINLPLQAGFVVTVEPGIYLDGRFGVRIEDDVVVTEDGIENLTGFRKDLLEVS